MTKVRHVAQLDNLLFRTGRKVNYSGKVDYCQVALVDHNSLGDPDGLIVFNRGDEPSDDNKYQLDRDDFKVCSQIEYMLNYGGGQPKSKWNRINQTGGLLDENILSEMDLKGYQGKSTVHFTIHCDMGEELTYLTEEGEIKQSTPEEYLISEVYDAIEEKAPVVKRVVKKPAQVKKEPKIKAKPVGKDKIKKVLFPESEEDSESEVEPEDQVEPAVVQDEIESFVVLPPTPKAASVASKYGMVTTELRLARHEALFNKELLAGKWKGMSIEVRADKLYRLESKRGRYENNRTVFQIWFFGNIGEDPIAYFSPLEKVPTSEVQNIPNGKWTTSVNPTKWILTMNDLSECLSELTSIAHEYYRYDVYMAIAAIAKKAHSMYDMDLAMAGVNAYRDLYAGALGAIVDGAVDGHTGDQLMQIALGEVHPSSKAYSDTICDRLQRVNAGSQWGKSSLSGGGSMKPNDRSKGGNGKNDKEDDKKKGMSEAQKDLVPEVNGRKVCLAFMSVRDCKRKDCLFLHDISKEVPEGLRNYFRKRFGASKPKQ